MSKLEKYLTKKELDSLEHANKSLKENIIAVTCIGLYNHGKSTLLNALIKDFNLKTFKTADIRETTLNKEVIYENIKYVDTPGLNAQDSDNEKVMEVIQTSDINLFIHAITTGEFNKKEIEFLIHIKKHWKNPIEFIERTIFVLSRTDNVSDYETIEKTKNKMEEQIRLIFESNCLIVPISSNDYIEGMLDNEDELIDESNIKELKKNIKKSIKKSKSDIERTRNQRVLLIGKKLREKLNSKIEKKEQEILEKNIEYEKFKEKIDKIENTLYDMYQRYQRLP